MKGISVVAVVYNEEHRISSFLDNFSWSDDLVVVDKSSTDQTADLIRRSSARYVSVPYSDGTVATMSGILDSCKHEWIWLVTASNLVHPSLVQSILELINKPDFDFDILEYPHIYYVLGIQDRRSPWRDDYRRWLARRSMLSVQDVVHQEVMLSPKGRTYRLPFHAEHAVHHLTHETLDTFFERHHRYARLEVEKYRGLTPSRALRKGSKDIWKAFRRIVFKRKSWLMGWNGFALGLAYLSYFFFVFLYVWQDKTGKGSREYENIRKRYQALWNDDAGKKANIGNVKP